MRLRFACLLVASTLVAFSLARPAEAHPQVISPNGGETWTGGTTQTVAWKLLINHGAGIMYVDFTRDGGITWVAIEEFNFDGSTSLLSVQWLAPNLSSTLCSIRVNYDWLSDSLADQSDGLFTISPSPTTSIAHLGGVHGGLLNFTFSFPSEPGASVFTFIALTSPSTPLNLPGGVQLNLTPDALTLVLLTNPAVSIATLDGQGVGETTPFPLPDNPGLRGINVWAAGAAFQIGSGFVEGTSTLQFQLL